MGKGGTAMAEKDSPEERRKMLKLGLVFFVLLAGSFALQEFGEGWVGLAGSLILLVVCLIFGIIFVRIAIARRRN